MNADEPRADNKFIQTWLTRQPSLPTYTKFQHIPLAEVANSRNFVFKPLAETVFIHHNDPEELHDNLAALGYTETIKVLDKRPRTPKTRKGNFGEILASEYLRQAEGYQIPVYRLRYNPNPESAMKGDDVLAFKFGDPDGKGREILIAEVKVRNTFAAQVITEAYDQLQCGHRPRPKSIPFIVTILRKENRHDEADQVLAFLHKFAPYQPTRRTLLFLVTGNNPRDPFGAVQAQLDVINDLLAINVCIPELNAFVQALFDYEVVLDGA
ncbi:MAG: hypothetical protein BroJett011_18270 [Chloroflexota bacterium]|nr:MAG: hypothetical protein BroJett011_18270 [Chloroflexota bacterium]